MQGIDAPTAPGGTQSIRRAVTLLREIAVKTPGGWRISDIARRCGMDRTTTHRILKCLAAEGLVMREGERYRLGPLAFELGLAAQPALDLRGLCRDRLTRIAARCGDTVFLNARSGYDSVCLDRCEGEYPVRALTVEIGARRPLCASAGGIAMLMLLPEPEQRGIMAENAQRLAATTRITLRTLTAMLEESLAAGYGLNPGRIIPAVTAVGVPIRNPQQEPVAALSVAAISNRLTPARRREIIALLRTEADQMERTLRELGAIHAR